MAWRECWTTQSKWAADLHEAQVRVNQARTGVDLKSLKMSMNPFCEIAVEQAIKMKEAGHASHLTALTIGDKA